MKLLLLLQRNHVHFTRDGAFQNVPLQNNKSSHHTDNIPSHVKTLHIDFLKHHENEVTGSEKLACNSLFEKLTHNPPPPRHYYMWTDVRNMAFELSKNPRLIFTLFCNES